MGGGGIPEAETEGLDLTIHFMQHVVNKLAFYRDSCSAAGQASPCPKA